MNIKLLTEHHLEFLSCQAAVSPCKLNVDRDFEFDSRTCDRMGLN